MNHRIRAGVLAGVGVSLVAGCAYLPQGYPSRTGAGQSEKTETEKLFVNTTTQVAGGNAALESLESAPMKGLRVRKSKRGNMDSYVVRGQRYLLWTAVTGIPPGGLPRGTGQIFTAVLPLTVKFTICIA